MSNLSTKNVERLLGELSSIKRSVEDLRFINIIYYDIVAVSKTELALSLGYILLSSLQFVLYFVKENDMRLTALFATRFPSEINPSSSSSSSSSTSEPNKINDEVNQFNCYYSNKLISYTFIFKILFDYLREDFIEFYFVRKDIFTKSILNYLQKDFDSKLDYPLLSTILNTTESQSLKVNLTILFLLF